MPATWGPPTPVNAPGCGRPRIAPVPGQPCQLVRPPAARRAAAEGSRSRRCRGDSAAVAATANEHANTEAPAPPCTRPPRRPFRRWCVRPHPGHEIGQPARSPGARQTRSAARSKACRQSPAAISPKTTVAGRRGRAAPAASASKGDRYTITTGARFHTSAAGCACDCTSTVTSAAEATADVIHEIGVPAQQQNVGHTVHTRGRTARAKGAQSHLWMEQGKAPQGDAGGLRAGLLGERSANAHTGVFNYLALGPRMRDFHHVEDILHLLTARPMARDRSDEGCHL